MSVSGLCTVCQKPDVDHSCDRCGALVCADHYAEDVGLCVECAAEVRGPGDEAADDEDLPNGVDTYRF